MADHKKRRMTGIVIVGDEKQVTKSGSVGDIGTGIVASVVDSVESETTDRHCHIHETRHYIGGDNCLEKEAEGYFDRNTDPFHLPHFRSCSGSEEKAARQELESDKHLADIGGIQSLAGW